jgi:hypothetical protein
VDEVPRLRSVAEYRRRLARAELLEEDGDNRSLQPGHLARAVHVRVAQDRVLPAVQAVPHRDIAFGRELGRPVWREGLERVILARRPIALAVDRATGGGEDDLRTLLLGGLEDVDRADHVVHGVLVGSCDGDADVGLRREVEARVGTEVREDVAERLADVPLHELGASGDVLAQPAREVVDHQDVVAAREQRVGEVRADEARAAGHDRPHAPILGRCS